MDINREIVAALKLSEIRFGGMLSDMANLARAKDAAISIVLRGLNANG